MIENHNRLFLTLRWMFLCILLSGSLAAQQSTSIEGRAFACSMSTTSYEVNYTPGHTYTWSLSGGGMITTPTDSSYIEILWTAGANGGPFIITMMETDLSSVTTTLTLEVNLERVIALACNSDLNVALDFSCTIMLTPDAVLEGMLFDNDSYVLTIKDPITKQIIPQGTSSEDYLNRPLEVSVLHPCSGNSCWGTVMFEDKLLPSLTCGADTITCNQSLLPDSLGFPVSEDVTITRIDELDNSYKITSFDPCGDVTLSYEDESLPFSCADPMFSGVLLRRWTAYDGESGVNTCTDTIRALRSTLDDLVMPLDTTFFLISCDGNFETLPNGAPTPEYSGSPSGPACANIYLEYDDVIVPLCGSSFKVIREWIITDACADEFRTFRQLIKVADAQDPIVDCPDYLQFSSDRESCGAGVDIPIPPIDDCSSVTFDIAHKRYIPGDDPLSGPYEEEYTSYDVGPTFNLPELKKGLNWVILTVIDDCGNSTICPFTVEITDEVEPVPVCDLHSVISLDEKGEAIIDAISFDDGSWDNCSPITLETRRMEASCSDTLWREHVTFCCNDVDSTRMVFLRVTDEEGNSSSCMVEVVIQDKVAPEITCPDDRSIDCNIDIWDLREYGEPIVDDPCGATFLYDTLLFLNKCQFGTIERIFTGIDSSGNTASCTQTLTLDNFTDPFTESDITWPQNYTIYDQCVEEDLHPDNLPTAYSYPRYNEDPCAHISFTYEDKFFAEADTACFVIIRTWTLIDGCQWENPHNPGQFGKWVWNQKLKVYNEIAPEFDDNCIDITLSGTGGEGCEFYVEYIKSATDDCNTTLGYHFELDLFANDTIDLEGEGNDASGTYPLGTHRMMWYVRDGCTNYNFCEQFFTIKDTKAPTPYCLDGISTVIMEEVGTVEVWASDLDLNSADNCSAQEDLRVSFSEDPSDNVIIYNCIDFDEDVFLDTVMIYVFDEAGNVDFCTTTLKIQKNENCDELSSGIIAGHIYSENDEMISDVQVNLLANGQMVERSSDEQGFFSYYALQMYQDYELSLSNNLEPKNGVSTLDLVLIQRHILGQTLLDSPYKIIAADINNSGKITATDLLSLRKLILGINKEFPDNDSWRFVSNKNVFEDPSNPFPYEEKMIIEDLDGSMMDADFVGVKIGDVNGSVNMHQHYSASVRKNTFLSLDNISIKKGQNYTVQLSKNEFEKIIGLQLALNYDNNIIDNLIFSSSNGDLSSHQLDTGEEVRLVLEQLQEDEIYISFVAKSNGKLDDALSLSQTFSNEAYVANGNIEAYEIQLRLNETDENSYNSFNSVNIPNPFKGSTTIRFELANDETVDFKVMDLDGNVISQVSGPFKKGTNEIQFDNTTGASGILIYTLITNTRFESKKMIVID